MTMKMLIDAAHPEETRVAVVDGEVLEEFDFETTTKKQLKGNIYLAKVVRVEPSLQAAFVEYGGNRHGFLAFSEIHPDYFKIPVSDKQVLERKLTLLEKGIDPKGLDLSSEDVFNKALEAYSTAQEKIPGKSEESPEDDMILPTPDSEDDTIDDVRVQDGDAKPDNADDIDDGPEDDLDAIQPAARDLERARMRMLREYKIQEVIKKDQILLVQVVKEERGNKGAALTTYISLPGRYCVLMPNTRNSGGISRKISSHDNRKRLKEILKEIDVPTSMSVIIRTAGEARTRPEIRRDYDYLSRLWSSIRETTLSSNAPALIYEEGDLVMRAVRDIYTRDIGEVLVQGEEAYKSARSLMKLMIPSHVKKIKLHEGGQNLFSKYKVESQLEAIYMQEAPLPSGGSIVINPTEALVAIDVNSGKATRERHIEETAYKTNLEAAQEVARQIRLRDLAGLVVVDFIDMDSSAHQSAVEKTLRDALKTDRAKVQVGRISNFGLLELSRQRLRPSLLELHSKTCPMCNGSGIVRSTESSSVYALRAIESFIANLKKPTKEVVVYLNGSVALYILNHKRDEVVALEEKFGLKIVFEQDDHLVPPKLKLGVRSEDGKIFIHQHDAKPVKLNRSKKKNSRSKSKQNDEVRNQDAPKPKAENGSESGEKKSRKKRNRPDKRKKVEDGTAASEKGREMSKGRRTKKSNYFLRRRNDQKPQSSDAAKNNAPASVGASSEPAAEKAPQPKKSPQNKATQAKPVKEKPVQPVKEEASKAKKASASPVSAPEKPAESVKPAQVSTGAVSVSGSAPAPQDLDDAERRSGWWDRLISK